MAGSAVVALICFFGTPRRDPARVKYMIAQAQVKVITHALDAFASDCGRYPDALRALVALGRILLAMNGEGRT